jgi:hypothetical protein
LYLSDRQGLPLALSNPLAGNHNDIYEIKKSSEELFSILNEAGISTDGLFINADSGFDSKDFRLSPVPRSVNNAAPDVWHSVPLCQS